MIRVDYVSDFHFGDDVVLLAMDGDGSELFGAALKRAGPQEEWRVEFDGRTHHFRVQSGAANVGLRGDRVEWCLDIVVIADMVAKLAAMRESGRPSHHYVDISTPADTLVLSVDEYPDTA